MTEHRFSRRALLIGGGGLLGAAVSKRAAQALLLPSRPVGSAATTPVRDPSIVRSWGGLVVPVTGAYWGADDTSRHFTSANGVETQLGRRMGIRNRQYPWLAPCPSPAAVADAALTAPKVVPMCSLRTASTYPVKSTPGEQCGRYADDDARLDREVAENVKDQAAHGRELRALQVGGDVHLDDQAN